MADLLQALVRWDKAALLWLNNSLRAPWLDDLMWYATATETWIPLFALVAWLLWRGLGARRLLAAALCVAALITASDRFASGLLKPTVQRPRPCRDAEIGPRVQLVRGKCSSSWSFVSSHAANSAALALFVTLALRLYRRRWGLSPLGWGLFGWAALHSYTRIYMGLHYPGDILAGGLLGAALAALTFAAYRQVTRLPWFHVPV